MEKYVVSSHEIEYNKYGKLITNSAITYSKGFDDKKEALADLYELTDYIMKKHPEELETNKIYRVSNENGERQTVRIENSDYSFTAWITTLAFLDDYNY